MGNSSEIIHLETWAWFWRLSFALILDFNYGWWYVLNCIQRNKKNKYKVTEN